MNLTHKPWLIAVAVIAAGGALVLLSRNGTPSSETTSPQMISGDQPAARVDSTNVREPEQAYRAPLPWESTLPATASPTGQAQAAADASSMGAASSLPVPDPVQMQKQLSDGGRALEEALVKFNEMEAAGKLPPEVDARAVRANIAIARRAQTLTSEMLVLAQQPAGEARKRRAEAIVAELRTLQTQIQFNTTRPVPTTR